MCIRTIELPMMNSNTHFPSTVGNCVLQHENSLYYLKGENKLFGGRRKNVNDQHYSFWRGWGYVARKGQLVSF
jgi:hypothetical protein